VGSKNFGFWILDFGFGDGKFIPNLKITDKHQSIHQERDAKNRVSVSNLYLPRLTLITKRGLINYLRMGLAQHQGI